MHAAFFSDELAWLYNSLMSLTLKASQSFMRELILESSSQMMENLCEYHEWDAGSRRDGKMVSVGEPFVEFHFRIF